VDVVRRRTQHSLAAGRHRISPEKLPGNSKLKAFSQRFQSLRSGIDVSCLDAVGVVSEPHVRQGSEIRGLIFFIELRTGTLGQTTATPRVGTTPSSQQSKRHPPQPDDSAMPVSPLCLFQELCPGPEGNLD